MIHTIELPTTLTMLAPRRLQRPYNKMRGYLEALSSSIHPKHSYAQRFGSMMSMFTALPRATGMERLKFQGLDHKMLHSFLT